MKTMKKAILGVALTLAVALVPASAATITGLFNTGVDGGGVVLANGAIDTHYVLTAVPAMSGLGPNAFVVIDGQFPFPPWLANSSTSKWIGPVANQSTGNVPPGNYTYELTSTCANTAPNCAMASLSGNWTSDNIGTILHNGSSTGVGGSPDMVFSQFTAFSIAGLSVGTNTLDFVVNNAGSVNTASGLRVEVAANAMGVPEPGTMMLGALGLLAVGLLRRRRS
jgi:MYXO-CTERM domain-containing protein